MATEYVHWLQGGPCDDLRLIAFIELPDEIDMLQAHSSAAWVRVPVDDHWPNAVRYRRVRSVEQVDREAIYYPVAERTESGRVLTDADFEVLADEAQRGHPDLD